MEPLMPVLGPIAEEIRTKAPEFAIAVAVLVVLTLLGHLLGSLLARILVRTGREARWIRLARRGVRWLFVLFGILLALQILGYTAVATSVLATGGIAAVVFGFAFKEIGENLLAGVFLAFSRSFDVGDLIESGGLRGVVRAIDLRATHVRTSDGCDIFIPSSQIFRQPLMNFTRDGLRRGSFTIGIDYGDDPARALVVVRDAVAGARGVLTVPPPTFEISKFDGAWMELQAHLWVDTSDPALADASISQIRTRAMTATRAALLEAGFTLSSDTTTALAIPPLRVALDSNPGIDRPDDPTASSDP